MTAQLDVLLIEARPGDAASAADRLEAAGHDVHRCWPVEPDPVSRRSLRRDDLCSALTTGTCPLERGVDVALLVRGRITPRPTVTEAGVTCALRAGIPVVEAGPDVLDPFDRWITARTCDDVAAACERAVMARHDSLRAAITARIRVDLIAAGMDPDGVAVSVEGRSSDLVIRLSGPTTTGRVRQALGVRVLDVVRASGRPLGQVDVAYTTCP